jgi:hypothetical protein
LIWPLHLNFDSSGKAAALFSLSFSLKKSAEGASQSISLSFSLKKNAEGASQSISLSFSLKKAPKALDFIEE